MKRPILYVIFFIVLLLTGDFATAGQTTKQGFNQSLTLEQCIEIGIQKNPSLKASMFNLSAAKHEIKAARADFLPSLSSSYSLNSISSESSKGLTETDYLDQTARMFNIKLTQILYAGSMIVNAYGKTKILEQVASAQKDLEELELVYNIETTFYKVMKAKQDVITVTESVNRLIESTKVARAFFEKELVAYVEVLQASVDLSDAKQQLGVTKNNLNRERMVLFSLIDLPFDPNIEFSEGLYSAIKYESSFELSLQHALENRPDIKALEYQLAVTDKDAKIAMGKYLPIVRFDIGYYDQDRDYHKQGVSFSGLFDRDQRNRYWSTGISATWDIFDGGRAWYGKEKYKTESKKIKALIKETQNMISTGIRKALYSMSEAEQRILISAETLSVAKEYYTREEHRLKAGISTIPSLLDAQDRLIRAQVNKTRAVLDYQLAESELRLMMGGDSNPTEK